MADPLLAQTSDLEARGVDVSDSARVAAALADASALIHHVSGRAWVDADTGALVADVPGIARTICCKVARRVLSGQDDGVDSETIGDYSVRWRNTDAYLTKGERSDIRSAAGLSGGIGVLRTTRGDLETPAVGCDPALDLIFE